MVEAVRHKSTPLLLQLPEDTLRLVMASCIQVDKLYSPLTAARTLALFAQTCKHIRAATYRFWPVMQAMNWRLRGVHSPRQVKRKSHMCDVGLQALVDMIDQTDVCEYKLQWPEVTWERDPLTCNWWRGGQGSRASVVSGSEPTTILSLLLLC